MELVTNADALDYEAFLEMSEKSEHVQNVLTSATNKEGMTDLLADGFASFFKYDPRIRDEVPANRHLHKKIIEQMKSLSEYENLRTYTRGDSVNSTTALKAVDEIFRSLPEEVKKEQDNLEQLEQALNDELQNDGNSDDIRDLLKQLNDSSEKLDQAIDKNQDEIRQTVRKTMKESTDEIAETEQACASLGWGSSDGTPNRTPIDQKLRIAQLLKDNKQLKRIMKLAGKFMHIAEKKQREKVEYVREEVEDITLGSELDLILPDELIQLAIPELEGLFLQKFTEHKLQQYELSGRASKGKGPIVVCIDCSSSMAGAPDIWSKAITLAMYSIARKQKRNFAALLYNTVVKDSFEITNHEKNVSGIMRVLSSGVSGGTKYTPVLREARNFIDKDEFKDADIVFITDGQCSIPDSFLEEFLEWKTDNKVSIYSVWISRNTVTEHHILSKFSDKVIPLGGNGSEMFDDSEKQVQDLCFSV